ncbi:MAG: caa(3)-type oxidase subunit IV [Alphaproteobacteria bacterium]|jgi:caa(3)-type oxidase subunit IV
MAAISEQKLHPISTYLKIWTLLFVLSTFSYLVDFYEVQSYLRWTLILIFMFAKAGLIVAFFMHLKWERLALIYTVLLPPIAIVVFIALMNIEANYVYLSRLFHFVNVG